MTEKLTTPTAAQERWWDIRRDPRLGVYVLSNEDVAALRAERNALKEVIENNGQARMEMLRHLEKAEISLSTVKTERDVLRRLATQATNGWACYARSKREHDEIARLHRDIEAALSAPAKETP